MPPLGSSPAAGDDGDKKSASGLGILWAAYISMLDTQPILTKSLTSLVGFAVGDLLAQKLLEKKVRRNQDERTSSTSTAVQSAQQQYA